MRGERAWLMGGGIRTNKQTNKQIQTSAGRLGGRKARSFTSRVAACTSSGGAHWVGTHECPSRNLRFRSGWILVFFLFFIFYSIFILIYYFGTK
jgi:hypothetical protein